MKKLLRMVCGKCNGGGLIYAPHVSTPAPCDVCNGSRWVFVQPENVCPECEGSGRFLAYNGIQWCQRCIQDGTPGTGYLKIG